MSQKTLRRLTEFFKLLKEVKVTRGTVKTLLVLTAMCLILASAFIIRSLPAKWGVYLHEFDPYLQYRVTERIMEKGFLSWLDWRDYKSWYPSGRDMTRTIYPGLPMTAAFFYIIAKTIGLSMTLYEFLCYFPIIMSVLTCIAIFYLGKDYGGLSVALLSSLFMAVCPAYISRTHLGWFDDETVGIFALTLLSLFYVRAMDPERDLKNSLAYALLTGVMLGYLFASWGTARYALGLLALSTFFIVLKDYRTKYVVSYGIMICSGLCIAISVPRVGLGIIREVTGVAALGLLIFLSYGLIVNRKVERFKMRLAAVTAFIAASIAVFYAAWTLGLVTGVPTKYYAVLEPLYRAFIPLIQSVGEHRPATWISFFTSLGFLLALIPVYVLIAVYELDNKHIFLVIQLLTTLYSAASYVRLVLILAAPACLAGAYSIIKILKSLTRVFESSSTARRRGISLGKEVIVVFGVLLVSLSVIPLVYFGIQTADSPVTLACSSVPVNEFRGDWIEALKWLKENVPDDSVVMAWWDYGYWITIMSNKTTLADNATLNSTQIAVIARTFLSPEEEAIQTMKQYNVSYVVVFVDFVVRSYGGYYYYQPEGYGEENKFIWMIRIAGLNETDYITNGNPTAKFSASLIGELIPFKFYPIDSGGIYLGPIFHESEHIKPVFYSSSLASGGYNGRVTGVVIYRVYYTSSD
ncbi:MAG: STT3 domain-containing protein [Candidatus Bathyarchaeia archaeon]